MEDFQYVVERKKPDPICFGSRLERDTNPIGKGLSPYQRRFAAEIFTKITPQTYHVEHLTSGIAKLQNKVASNRGAGGLANIAPRFHHKIFTRIPSPTRYDPEQFQKIFCKSKAPFGRTVERESEFPSTAPGPGTYDTVTKRCRRTKFAYNFGRPKMIPAVEVICDPLCIYKCDVCNEICKNDFWHKNYTSFLCHNCMVEEKFVHEKYTKLQLKVYEKIRTCSYKHSHEGTTAAIQLLPKGVLDKTERLENYLALFM